MVLSPFKLARRRLEVSQLGQLKSLVETLNRPNNAADEGHFIAGKSSHLGFMRH